MQPKSSYFSFIQALNVMNAALDLHRDSGTFRNWLPLLDTELEYQNLVVAIHEDDNTPLNDYVTIRWQNGAFVLVAHRREEGQIAWRVSEQYLKDVAASPRRYLEDPQQLDFDWLKLKLGLLSPAVVNSQSRD